MTKPNWEKWSTITSAVSAFLSVVVGGTGIWLGLNALDFSQRIETARLTPILEFASTANENLEIKLLNLNSAPAYIKNFEVARKGEHTSAVAAWNYSKMEDALEVKDISNGSNPYLGWLNSDSYLGPSEPYYIFRYENYKSNSPEEIANIRSKFYSIGKNIFVSVTYCNIWKENCETKTFERN